MTGEIKGRCSRILDPGIELDHDERSIEPQENFQQLFVMPVIAAIISKIV